MDSRYSERRSHLTSIVSPLFASSVFLVALSNTRNNQIIVILKKAIIIIIIMKSGNKDECLSWTIVSTNSHRDPVNPLHRKRGGWMDGWQGHVMMTMMIIYSVFLNYSDNRVEEQQESDRISIFLLIINDFMICWVDFMVSREQIQMLIFNLYKINYHRRTQLGLVYHNSIIEDKGFIFTINGI